MSKRHSSKYLFYEGFLGYKVEHTTVKKKVPLRRYTTWERVFLHLIIEELQL